MRCQHCDAELAAGEQVCAACGTAAHSIDTLSVTAAEKPEIWLARKSGKLLVSITNETSVDTTPAIQ